MNKIKAWLEKTIYKDYDIKIASSDASFRKYYRLTLEEKSVLLMDSSLEIDSLKPFIDVTSKLSCVGVNVPIILEKNLVDGFLIISDFGDTHYLNILNEENFKELYKKAMLEIIKMQKSNVDFLPIYDKEFLHFEMDLMSEWYLEKKLNISLSDNDKKLIEKTLNKISEEVLKQPQNVFVHRDFHSRNIMITKDKNIGVIDYQDAMSGAITYDLVSLLKDCYIEFNREDIESLVLDFRDMLGLSIDDKTFIKYFDFMGLQRHIKVLGVFSRLELRDKKDGYLKDIPLTLKYVIDTALRYKETKELAIFLQKVQK
jgi:aminoglycoside/choline kinase family phosphotransferase